MVLPLTLEAPGWYSPLPSASVPYWKSLTESSCAPATLTLLSHPVTPCFADWEHTNQSPSIQSLSLQNISTPSCLSKIFQSLAVFTHAIQKLKTALYWLPNKVSHPDFLFFMWPPGRISFHPPTTCSQDFPTLCSPSLYFFPLKFPMPPHCLLKSFLSSNVHSKSVSSMIPLFPA